MARKNKISLLRFAPGIVIVPLLRKHALLIREHRAATILLAIWRKKVADSCD